MSNLSEMNRDCASRKQIILDCDDVLLDWTGAFADFAESRHPSIFQAQSQGPNDRKIATHSRLDALPREEALRIVEEFNSSSFFEMLPPLEGAVDAIRSMRALGFRIDVISSCSGESRVVEMRRKNLASVFGNAFATIACLDLCASKKDAFASFPPCPVIEDNLGNALDAHDLGHLAIVLEQPHNAHRRRDHRHLPWARSWEDTIDILRAKIVDVA